MKFAFRCAMVLLGLALAPGWLQARSSVPPPFIQDRALGASLARQLEIICEAGDSPLEINAKGRRLLADAYSPGGRWFNSAFPHGFSLDLTKPDIRRVATNLLRGNANNWHGYERELKYLDVLSLKNSRFQLLKVGDRDFTALGNLVEFDALLRDKRSGRLVSAEFKDWKITSRLHLEKAKQQIDRISHRAREQGVARSIWVNHEPMSDEFRDELVKYGEQRRVSINTGISTGKSSGNPAVFSDILEAESRGVGRYVRWTGRLVGGGATLYGAVKGGYAAYAWQQGGMSTRVAVETGSEAAGAAAGGFAGGAAGGQLGLWAGSAFPPAAVVTVPAGIFLGGLAGAIAGSWGGRAAGETLVDEVIFKDLEHNETAAVIAYLQQQY